MTKVEFTQDCMPVGIKKYKAGETESFSAGIARLIVHKGWGRIIEENGKPVKKRGRPRKKVEAKKPDSDRPVESVPSDTPEDTGQKLDGPRVLEG